MRKRRYPPDWDLIAITVKDRADWKCEVCSTTHGRATDGAILTVHHLDTDTTNSATDNLIALCQRCHLRAEKWSRAGEYLSRAECVEKLSRILHEENAQRSLFD